MLGDACVAICVYTGDLVNYKTKNISSKFVEKYSTQHYDPTRARTKSKSIEASSHSSSQSIKSAGSSQYEYLNQLIRNVSKVAGLHHLIPFLDRQGKSRLSMQKVVK